MRWPGRRPAPALDWLVVGLGNPGSDYAGTRHNVGREVVDGLAQRHGIALGSTRYQARYGSGRIGAARVGLALPLTYMNLSGQAVAPLARFYKLPPASLLLVVDDLDLPLGSLRLRPEGGSGGHNGLTSVFGALGSSAVPRLRLGIGRPPPGWDAADYVLARFGAAERDAADEMVRRAAEAVERVVAEGVARTMNAVNG